MYYNIINKGITMALSKLKELNENKEDFKKFSKSYIIITPVIPIKSGEDVTRKIRNMYNNFKSKFY